MSESQLIKQSKKKTDERFQAAMDKVTTPGFWKGLADPELEKNIKLAMRYIYDQGVRRGTEIVYDTIDHLSQKDPVDELFEEPKDE